VPDPKPVDPGPKNDGPANNGPVAGGAISAMAARGSLRTVLKRGLKVTVQVPGNGKLAVTVKRGGKVVAKAPAKRVAAGSVAMTAKFTAAGKRALKRARTARLAISVAFTPDGGAKQTASLGASLRR
jgi:hypothetical protein